MQHKFSKTLLASLILSSVGSTVYAENNNEQSRMKNESTKLETIVVSASGFEQNIKKAAATISVLSQEDINKKAYRDVTDALKDVPGVVVTGGGSSSDISIRGMGSAYTVIMIDGKKVNTRSVRPNSDNSGIEQGWLPGIESIERIEVIRGPMSGLYGSDAIGGVLYFNPEKFGKQNSSELNFNQKYFSNTIGFNSSVGYKLSGEDLKFSARLSNNKHADYKIPDGNRVTNTRYNETDFKTALGYSNSKFTSSIE